MVAVVQLVRASDCGSECRGFESHLPPPKEEVQQNELLLFFIPINFHTLFFISNFAAQKQKEVL